MTKIGEGYMFGRHAAFRTYETPDHTEALVWYGEFRSEEESKLATELSLEEHRITGTEHVKDLNGHVIGDRIVATPKDEKKAFMVIRKQGPNYWIIQSISLAVAMQVDELIEPPPLAAFAENPSSMRQIQRTSAEAAAVVQGGAEEGSPGSRDGSDRDQRGW
jgi:hypothetical protein